MPSSVALHRRTEVEHDQVAPSAPQPVLSRTHQGLGRSLVAFHPGAQQRGAGYLFRGSAHHVDSVNQRQADHCQDGDTHGRIKARDVWSSVLVEHKSGRCSGLQGERFPHSEAINCSRSEEAATTGTQLVRKQHHQQHRHPQSSGAHHLPPHSRRSHISG